MIKTFIHRFFWKTETEKFNPFLPFLSIINLIIGLIFLFGANISAVNSLILFTVLGNILPVAAAASIWGGILVLVFILHCLEMYFRAKGFGPYAAMGGFIIWLYAAVIYVGQFAVMGIFAIAAIQLFFWGWYYVSAKVYKRDVEGFKIEMVD